MDIQTTEVKEKTKVRKNLERFLQVTGKSEKEYYEWATQVGRQGISTKNSLFYNHCMCMSKYYIKEGDTIADFAFLGYLQSFSVNLSAILLPLPYFLGLLKSKKPSNII